MAFLWLENLTSYFKTRKVWSDNGENRKQCSRLRARPCQLRVCITEGWGPGGRPGKAGEGRGGRESRPNYPLGRYRFSIKQKAQHRRRGWTSFFHGFIALTMCPTYELSQSQATSSYYCFRRLVGWKKVNDKNTVILQSSFATYHYHTGNYLLLVLMRKNDASEKVKIC